MRDIERPSLLVAAATSLLTIPVGAFLYFVSAADAVMDKSGIGDLTAFQMYNFRAGIAFWLAVFVWCALVVFAFYAKQVQNSLSVACTLVPISAFCVWIGFIGP